MNQIYIAGPLFSLAEKQFNIEFVSELENHTEGFSFILPQIRAKQYLDLDNSFQMIFDDCLKCVETSQAVIGILDGPDADSGTCVELGYAYARGVPVIGVRTDLRASEELGVNLMLSNLCDLFILEPKMSLSQLASKVARALTQIIRD